MGLIKVSQWVLFALIHSIILPICVSQPVDPNLPLKCPENWVRHESSCYRFVKSPMRPRAEASKNCLAYDAELVNINNQEEHRFITQELNYIDPQHRRWYTGGKQQSPNYWINEGDGSSLAELSQLFLPERNSQYYGYQLNKDYIVYNFSSNGWGFEKVTGDEHLTYICEAPFSRLAHLVIEERTFTYGIDIDDPEKIPRGPYFVKQPVPVVYDLQKSESKIDVEMTCIAKGYPTPTYEWFKEDYENDKIISKRIDPMENKRYTLSGGSLIINSPQQVVDRGSYYCKATNKFGSIVSETVLLSFGFIGEFNLKRSVEYGQQNWGKSIFCDPPEFYPKVKFYWARSRFPDLVEEDKRVFVSFDGALYFAALEQIDQGNYSCNVLSEGKEASAGKNGPVFPLIVQPNANPQQLQFANTFPKVFPEAPIAGKEVRLECVAFGYPIPSYNWTRKAGHLPKGSYMANHNRVLIIPKIRMEDEGEYICRINNDQSIKEASISLRIQAEPNFTIPITDRHVDWGTDLTWTCEAFGVPDVSYKWYKNGEPLIPQDLLTQDSARYIIQDNILTIKYVDERDNGMYQCRAKNTHKVTYSSAQLRVLKLAPTFKKRPLDAEIYAGENNRVSIICNPEAAPRPKFTWKKEDYNIGSGGPKYIIDGNLTISPVSRSDAGRYTCIAANEYGSDRSVTKLTVLRLPTFVEALPQKIGAIVGQNLELRCFAASEDLLDVAYVWYHNSLRLQTTQSIYSSLVINGGSLSFYNMSFANAGTYQCVVKTVVGSLSSSTELRVDGPPSPPGGVQVHEVIKKSVTLRWTDGATNGRPILFYIISARTNWNSEWRNVSQTAVSRRLDVFTDRKEVTLEDVVTPYASYEFRIYAVNELGTSLPSETSPQYNIPADAPYVYPQNVSGGGGKIGDLTITWTPLPLEDHNGPGMYYKVYWRRKGFDKEFAHQVLRNATKHGIATVPIPSEFYYTEYEVKVQAANREGYGPESPVVTIFSAEDIPHIQPQSLIAKPYNSTAINASWSPISLTRENIRGKLIGHRLKYWLQGAIEDSATYYLNRNTDSWALIVGLQPDTYYYIKVMAFNVAGAGPESERILERTYRKAPSNPPTSVFVKGVNPSTIKVVWRYVAPNQDEEPVSGFKVRVWPMDEDLSRAVDTIVPIGSTLEAYVYNLLPGKRYYTRVLAYSSGGDGRMSSPANKFQMGHEESFVNSAPRCASYSLTILILLFVFRSILL